MRHSGALAVLALVLLAADFALMLGPLYLQRNVFPSVGKFVAGPVHGFLLVTAPTLAFLYLLLSLAFLADAGRRQGRSYRPVELLQLLHSGRRGWVTATILIGCFSAVGYGTSAYWYATAQGVIVNPGWPSQAVTYNWSDVIKRSISCYRAKGGPNVEFRVWMVDGRALDLAETQQTDFATHFAELTALTRNADTEIGQIEKCPPFIRTFIRRN